MVYCSQQLIQQNNKMKNNDVMDDLPQLVPYNKNKYYKDQAMAQKPAAQPSKPEVPQISTQNIMYNILSANLSKSNEPSPQDTPKPQINVLNTAAKQISALKLQQIKKNRNTERAIKVDRQIKPVEDATGKQVHKTNKIINKMINQSSMKNVVDQMFPFSLETINKNIEQLKNQIQQLHIRAMQLQIQLQNNPNNLAAEREKQNIQKLIAKLDDMRYMYEDKIDMRNQNKRLLQLIQNLKHQNKEIRGKVMQGMQRIEKQKHHLPCELEKNLIIQLANTRKQLEKQKKMRQNLQNKVQNTIQDFARLYNEADIARKIIITKSKQIESGSQMVQNGFFESSKKNNLNTAFLQKQLRDLGGSDPTQQYDNNTSRVGVAKNSYKYEDNEGYQDTTLRKGGSYQANSAFNDKQLNMQQKINKMRNNQMMFRQLKF